MDNTVSEEDPQWPGGFTRRDCGAGFRFCSASVESIFCILGGSDASDAKSRASDLAISDDLRSLHFADMRLLIGEQGSVRLGVREARVTGLSPWGRASNLRPAVRAFLLSTTGIGLALLASLHVLARSIAHRLTSLVVGGAGPAAALLVLSRLEQGDHGAWAYLWVPVAGAAALALAAFASRRWPGRA